MEQNERKYIAQNFARLLQLITWNPNLEARLRKICTVEEFKALEWVIEYYVHLFF